MIWLGYQLAIFFEINHSFMLWNVIIANHISCILGCVKKQNSNFWFYRNVYLAVSIYTETYLVAAHILFFRFKILKWTFDNFGSAGWIVEVRMKLLTPILAYIIFDIYVICYHHYMTYLTFMSYMTYYKWLMKKIT